MTGETAGRALVCPTVASELVGTFALVFVAPVAGAWSYDAVGCGGEASHARRCC